MPIRFMHSSVKYECDTPEEAIQLRQLLGEEQEPPQGQGAICAQAPKIGGKDSNANGVAIPSGNHSGIAGRQPKHKPMTVSFLKELNSNGLKLLRALARQTRPALTEDIAHAAGMAPRIIGPILKHVYAVAERNGLDKEALFQTAKDPGDKFWKVRYTLREPIRKALEGMDEQIEEETDRE